MILFMGEHVIFLPPPPQRQPSDELHTSSPVSQAHLEDGAL